jgi:hypothetical protein
MVLVRILMSKSGFEDEVLIKLIVVVVVVLHESEPVRTPHKTQTPTAGRGILISLSYDSSALVLLVQIESKTSYLYTE